MLNIFGLSDIIIASILMLTPNTTFNCFWHSPNLEFEILQHKYGSNICYGSPTGYEQIESSNFNNVDTVSLSGEFFFSPHVTVGHAEANLVDLQFPLLLVDVASQKQPSFKPVFKKIL